MPEEDPVMTTGANSLTRKRTDITTTKANTKIFEDSIYTTDLSCASHPQRMREATWKAMPHTSRS